LVEEAIFVRDYICPGPVRLVVHFGLNFDGKEDAAAINAQMLGNARAIGVARPALLGLAVTAIEAEIALG
jgi:hypothetical protein